MFGAYNYDQSVIPIYFDRNKLKSYRIKLKMSQSELAFELGTYPDVISKIESGIIKSPRFDMIYRVTKIFDCAMEDLVKEDAKFKFPMKHF